jgi:tetratricopeptide (TPR) repeat protein
VKAERTSTCQACGAQFPAGLGFCGVCALRLALDEGNETVEMSVAPTPSVSALRFDHYQVVMREDGTALELGRGAMGVTYKAIDINLRCAVALKVINARFIGEESAPQRFVREARAAASVRHPNVALVFHLGKSGDGYFYAMEYVEGETLEKVIKRSGGLQPKVALEITRQVAAGLGAIHEQNLVHRDIKPTNIMVSLKDGGRLTAKIIDLGLAKPVADTPTEVEISTPGAFAGTPAFASPEQFAGVGVDIRSDLYSLGAVLWEMVTGRVVFTGSPAEMMYQHQHAPLPLDQLENLPQPVVVLLEALLEKDPARRFQNPTDLLKAIPTIADAIDAGRRISRRKLPQVSPPTSRPAACRPGLRQGPKKISVARLPVTGSDLFGREEDIAFLDAAWENPEVNVVTIVAWAGVGKSTLLNHWLGRMAAEHYRSARLVFGWSFYRQGTSRETSSADEFLDTALNWFGDPDPRLGTAWEKGERLAKLAAHRRTLLVLDGLEPLQNPPGPKEGRVRDPSVQALLRELAAFNRGLCVITTRMPIPDFADHERTSALRRDLEQLSSEAGVKLLRALGVEGDEADLRAASDEFAGHCLALTLLGSYLGDVYNGDIRCRNEVSRRLAQDTRQGVHARKVMESYQAWFGEGPELAVLRMLGLFDRPADEKALEVLLKPPVILGLPESLTDLSPTERRTIVARLRRARLLAPADPHRSEHIDAHPIVREYFGEQLRSRQPNAWKECNRRLYHYYRTLAPELPNNLRDMEPLFSAVICACNADLYREALHDVYIPRIQRGDASFAARVLGARGALLAVLTCFFEPGSWGSFAEARVEARNLLAPEDQLFVLMEAGLLLTYGRGMGALEARICYERAEALCHSLNRPGLLYLALTGQWRYSFMNENLDASLHLAKRVYAVARKQNNRMLMIGAYRSLVFSLYHLGEFEAASREASHGVELWQGGVASFQVEEMNAPVVTCLIFKGLCEWHFAKIASGEATMSKAVSVAQALNDMHGLGAALLSKALFAYYERDPVRAERFASQAIEISMRQNFATWLALATVLRHWARSALDRTSEGVLRIGEGILSIRVTRSVRWLPYGLAMKAEALHLGGHTPEALEAINEAEELTERSGECCWSAELYRLRGVFLAAMGADETQIEASFCGAIRTAKMQKSISLEKRAEASCAEYRRQSAGAAGRRGFQLPL